MVTSAVDFEATVVRSAPAVMVKSPVTLMALMVRSAKPPFHNEKVFVVPAATVPKSKLLPDA